MAEHDLGPVEDWPAGKAKMVTIDKREILVVRGDDDQCYALNDACPHYGASLSLGTVDGTMLPSKPQEYVYGLDKGVVRCPWHGWEFRLYDGAAVGRPDRLKIRTYEVRVVDDRVLLSV
ncbi:MAG: Rieske (2Fe-2S) protein [Nitriliruptoraceae bacterium]